MGLPDGENVVSNCPCSSEAKHTMRSKLYQSCSGLCIDLPMLADVKNLHVAIVTISSGNFVLMR